MTVFNQDLEGCIARHLLGTTTPEDQKILEQWLAESPSNRERLEALQKSQGFAASARIYRRIDEKAAFRSFRQRTGGRRIAFSTWSRYAAVFLLPVALVTGYFMIRQQPASRLKPDLVQLALSQNNHIRSSLVYNNGKIQSLNTGMTTGIAEGFNLEGGNTSAGLSYQQFQLIQQVQIHELKTPAGAEYNLTLADGTHVRLNACSKLRYPTCFKGATRDVELTGEAFFEVAKRSHQPFRIHTSNLIIKQYGTTFNVNTFNPDRVQVALVEGSIGLLHGKQETRLKSSQLGTFNTLTGNITVQTTDLTPFVSWNQGQFVFENETLGNMMATVERWYNVSVRFSSPAAASYRFTGSLSRNTSLNDLLNIIRYSTDVKVTLHGQEVLISKGIE